MSSGKNPSYSCLNPVERALVELRKFRAEMTVAALRCNQQGLYNEVVTRHQGELVNKGKALGETFQRLHGAAGSAELNRYVTHLTNRASIDSLGVRNYCRSMSEVFLEALKTPVRGLMAFVSENALAQALARNNNQPVPATAITVADKTNDPVPVERVAKQ
jgi:hypothetical protein